MVSDNGEMLLFGSLGVTYWKSAHESSLSTGSDTELSTILNSALVMFFHNIFRSIKSFLNPGKATGEQEIEELSITDNLLRLNLGMFSVYCANDVDRYTVNNYTC